MKHINLILAIFCILNLLACESNTRDTAKSTTEKATTTKAPSLGLLEILKASLTFYSSFDNGPSADFAKGDGNIYTATSRKEVASASAGMTNEDHQIVQPGQSGGNAFKFGKQGKKVIFYKSKDNVPAQENNWTGTISFWLKVDPVKDLVPGYTDPIQITDVNYNDAAIWVDFTKDNPRDFRLGVFGDKEVWTKDTLTSPVDTVMENRIVRAKELPFSGEEWTHVLITYQALSTPQSRSTLYLNGEKMGTIEGISDAFTWEFDKSNIFLGLGFIGLMDEISIYNIAFTPDQVEAFYQLKNGVKSIFTR